MKLVYSRKLDAYHQLLGTLFLILHKIRTKGLIAIEDDIYKPKESPIFTALAEYDQANEVVYVFMCDVLNLMVCGYLNIEETQRYMDAYRKTSILSDEQAALFDCVRLTLIATLSGSPPIIAVEHGRQGILPGAKPTFQELDDFIRSVKKTAEPTAQGTDSKLKLFYGSLGTE